MQAHLVFKADHTQRIALAGIALGIGDQLGHHEKADAFGAGHAIGQAGKHEVAGIGNEIIVGPADENLLAGDGIGAVIQGFGLGPKRTHVRTGLRLGQVHRAVPFAADELGQVERLELVAGVVLERLDLALAHQGIELQRKAGARHHVVDCGGERLGQAHAAMFGIGGHANPATFSDSAIAFGKARRSADNSVLKNGGMQVACTVQRGKDIIAHPASLGQDRLGHVWRGFRKTVGASEACEIDDLVENKGDIGNGRTVGHGSLFLARLGKTWRCLYVGELTAR